MTDDAGAHLRTAAERVGGRWTVVCGALLVASIVMAVLVGVIPTLWRSTDAIVIPVVAAPAFVGIATWGVLDGLLTERKRESDWPDDYKRFWGMFVTDTIIAPIVLGLVVSLALVAALALGAHGLASLI